MDHQLRRRPGGITLNALSEQVYAVLARYTAYPWPVLEEQAHRENIPPESLTPEVLERLIDPLGKAVARFTTPFVADEVRAELRVVLDEVRG